MKDAGVPLQIRDIDNHAENVCNTWFRNVTNGVNTYLNAPAFSATCTTNQAFLNSTPTKVQFDSLDFDTANCYSTSNYRYTPNIAGYYNVTATVNNTQLVMLYKNGSEIRRGDQFTSIAVTVAISTTGLIYLNGTTDYIEIYAYQQTGGTVNIDGGLSYFSGFLVRPV